VGTGKTETLVRKYAYLMSTGVKPKNILCVTFTNKAAKEMRSRAALFIGESAKDEIWINTFHAVSARILCRNKNYEIIGLQAGYHIIDKNDQNKVLTTIMKENKSARK